MAVVPRGSPFDKLPDEVVEHIFLRGCEMSEPTPKFGIKPTKSDYAEYDGPIHRRLKPFALDVRCVCSKWRVMIDLGLARYWIARLVLVIPSYIKISLSDNGRESTDDEKKTEKVFFAKQMVQFQRQLADPRGCDLDIFIASSESLKNWDVTMDPYSETGSMLRLLTHTIVGLKEYCKQIVKIEVVSDEPHVLLNAFALLSIIPRQDSRLTSFHIKSSTSAEAAEVGMKMELETIWNRSGVQFSTNTPPDLSHLTSLDELNTSNKSWFDGELQIPNGMSSLMLHHKPFNTPWLKVFTRRQPHSFDNLT